MCLIIFSNGFPSISLNVSSSSSSINLQVLLGDLGRCLPIRFIPLFWTCNLAPSELRKWESLPARQKGSRCAWVALLSVRFVLQMSHYLGMEHGIGFVVDPGHVGQISLDGLQWLWVLGPNFVSIIICIELVDNFIVRITWNSY